MSIFQTKEWMYHSFAHDELDSCHVQTIYLSFLQETVLLAGSFSGTLRIMRLSKDHPNPLLLQHNFGSAIHQVQVMNTQHLVHSVAVLLNQ